MGDFPRQHDPVQEDNFASALLDRLNGVDRIKIVALSPESQSPPEETPAPPPSAKRPTTIAVLTVPRSRKRAYSVMNCQEPLDAADGDGAMGASAKKIPRPPNAFMLFANQWRKRLALQNPSESNKDISVRLGAMWKDMPKEEKETYFALSREVDAEHKKKYPNYVYNPKVARMRKAMREQSREQRSSTPRSVEGHSGAWGKSPGAYRTMPQAGPSRMFVGEQPRIPEDSKKAIREQVTQGMIPGYTESFLDGLAFHPMGGNVPGGDYALIAEMDGQQWYPYLQNPQGGPHYVMRHGDEPKMAPTHNWAANFGQDSRGQQASYMMRQPIGNGFMSHGMEPPGPSQAATGNSLHTASAVPPQFNSYSMANSSNNAQPHPSAPKENVRRELIELIPPTQPARSKPTGRSSSRQQQSKMASKMQALPSGAPDKSTVSTATSSTTTSTSTTTATTNTVPLPAFEAAFGSTEIGRYSQGGFFPSSTQQQSEENVSKHSDGPPAQPEPAISHPLPTNDRDEADALNFPCVYYVSPNQSMDSNILTLPDGSKVQGAPVMDPMPMSLYSTSAFRGGPPFTFLDYAILPDYMSGGVTSESMMMGLPGQRSDGPGMQAVMDTSQNTFRDFDGFSYINLSMGPSAKQQQRSTSIDTKESHTNNAGVTVDGPPDAGKSNTEAHLEAGNAPKLKCKNRLFRMEDLPNTTEQSIKQENSPTPDIKLTGIAVGKPPIIISETEKICVMMESSNTFDGERQFSAL